MVLIDIDTILPYDGFRQALTLTDRVEEGPQKGAKMITSATRENFKGFKHLELPELPRVTLLGGQNNVGKTSVAIVRDADTSHTLAFESIRGLLQKHGQPCPKKPADTTTSVGLATQRGYWQFEHEGLANLRAFLRQLAE